MKKAGLVLEGGATRGVFTAGVLDCLMEQEIYFPYVVGVSAGACNAIDYVAKQIGRTKKCMIPESREYNYMNLRNGLKQKSVYDMDMIFDRFPNEMIPFDFETYFSSDMECELVVTNCETGKAEYLNEKEDKERLMKICRASSSMPLASPMVFFENVPYLDGGLADSVPLAHALKKGYKKNFVVLTRNKGYRKEPSARINRLYIAAYRNRPELVKTMCHRADIYNKQMDLIDRLEESGKIFVLRPETGLVSRTEKNKEKLNAFYQHGYDHMKNNLDRLKEYLEK